MQRDVIRFEKTAILRKEMLESMYNYPRIVSETFYSRYSDGILYGLEWIEENGFHFISPGAIKYKGELYFQIDKINIEESLKVDELTSGHEYYIVFRENKAINNFSQDTFSLKISATDAPVEDGFCYRYFKYELGKVKKLDNKVLLCSHASPDINSFSIPISTIAKDVCDILESKKNKHPLDYDVFRCIISNSPISISFMKLYISEYNQLNENKLEINYNYSNNNANVRELADNFIEAMKTLSLPLIIGVENNKNALEKTEDFSERGNML